MVLVREAARLFNSKELAAVASGEFDFLLKVASRYRERLDENFLVRDVFECCFNDFKDSYRNEYYFKNLVARKILVGRHSLKSATMVSEFRVGLNKADCVILNGSSTCYEIKSEYDSLSRLPEQLDSYLKIFDKVFVITTENHLSKVTKLVPASVGILKLGKRGALSEVKPATLSNQDVDVEMLMSSIRKTEYLMLVENIFGKAPGPLNGSTYDACKQMLELVDSSTLRAAFCKTLKTTRKIDERFACALPDNMLAAAIEYKFSAANRAGLIDNLNLAFSKDAICITRSSEESGMS
ncbi:hypothetical protein CXF92_18285 [Pseudomonas sp. Choline-3u-10]|jgi:hypothetical protein|uniref:sce7726 family protein n=1 Tax=Pseudomonadaceae TaxID=135621 RepID=UPI00061816A6|nr:MULTISPECIES: sce7726 family protein [Pseudomonadaceae]MAL37235.1 hypothetical protein [Pseudomonas sp.]KJJ63638.1 hypothetical protein RT21_10015 [Pseudomonas sp. 10B238]MBK3794536.1 sce7726 family protein [Stutzerimonas stutzeri]MBK3879111.1 sce7726 family protein [Stutzerimonas stutzeri]PKG91712.1 hypothetical protein CXF92_18285 [Pseudomonas sp. Choline-3u-10]|tara:strand:- start:9770 stop:10657 length:888 start_codon:yes stop_codon:yes gene_type:complete